MLKNEQYGAKSNTMNQWYLIQFKPNSYRQAERHLTSQGFKTFLPMQETLGRKASRFVSRLKPLFPGYMFIQLDPDIAPWRKVSNTIGVSKIVSFEGKPKPLPPKLISTLIHQCDCNGKILPNYDVCKGDSVKLLSSPFTNFLATVDKIDREKRIWVLLEFMGHKTRLKLSQQQIETTK